MALPGLHRRPADTRLRRRLPLAPAMQAVPRSAPVSRAPSAATGRPGSACTLPWARASALAAGSPRIGDIAACNHQTAPGGEGQGRLVAPLGENAAERWRRNAHAAGRVFLGQALGIHQTHGLKHVQREHGLSVGSISLGLIDGDPRHETDPAYFVWPHGRASAMTVLSVQGAGAPGWARPRRIPQPGSAACA